MCNLKHLTINKFSNDLTNTTSNCPPNPTLNRYKQAEEKRQRHNDNEIFAA